MPAHRTSRSYQIENWCLQQTEVKDMISQVWQLHSVGSSMYALARRFQLFHGDYKNGDALIKRYFGA